MPDIITVDDYGRKMCRTCGADERQDTLTVRVDGVTLCRCTDPSPYLCDHEDSHNNGHGARECNTCGSSIVDGWVHPPHGEMFKLASVERCDTCGRHTGGSCGCQNCGACASGLLFCSDCDMTEARN